MKSVCCIVDAYSSGNFLAPEFAKRGYPTIHVQTTKDIFPILKPSFQSLDFVENFAYEGDLESLKGRLRQFPITCLLPGTETGVELADRLSEELGLPSNGTFKSAARRNKYEMIEQIRLAGLAVARQTASDKAEDLAGWYLQSGLKKVVVKPIASAGTEDVRVCLSADEIRSAHAKIIGKTNLLGIKNESVVIQEFLDGEEYFVNSVSLEGNHHITDMWKHRKRNLNGHDFVYDCAELCPSQGEAESQISQYLIKVLDALNVRFGPAHSEVMMTSEGPKIIETGTRIQGMSVPRLNQECIGYGPVDLTADAYLDKEEFQRKSAQAYQLKKHALRVNLIAHRDGILNSLPGDNLIRSLKSFFYLRWIKEPGMKVSKTVNYFTVPGFVILVDENKERLFEDYARIRAWEDKNEVLNYE